MPGFRQNREGWLGPRSGYNCRLQIAQPKKGTEMKLREGLNRPVIFSAAALALVWLVGVKVAAGGGQAGRGAQQPAGTPGSQQQVGDKPMLSDQAFKNVQVLK